MQPTEYFPEVKCVITECVIVNTIKKSYASISTADSVFVRSQLVSMVLAQTTVPLTFIYLNGLQRSWNWIEHHSNVFGWWLIQCPLRCVQSVKYEQSATKTNKPWQGLACRTNTEPACALNYPKGAPSQLKAKLQPRATGFVSVRRFRLCQISSV